MNAAVAPSAGATSAAARQAWSDRRAAILIALTLASVALGVVLFVGGQQPLAYDARGYVEAGQRLYHNGIWTFVDKLRTYGYPTVLSLVMHVVGPDGPQLPAGIFVAHLAIYLTVAFVTARRVARILNNDALVPWVYGVLALNLFALAYATVALTESLSASLILLATVMAVPLPEERGRPSTGAMAASLLSASFAAAVRPANIAVVGAIGAAWLYIIVTTRANARQTVGRLALASLFVALPLSIQSGFNLAHWGSPTPLIVEPLYGMQLELGVPSMKYATLSMNQDAVPSTADYFNPFTQAYRTPAEIIMVSPGAYLMQLGLHVFGLLDQDYLFPYVQDLDPWYRWPASILNYALVAVAAVGLVRGLRSSRRRLFVTVLWVLAAYLAIYLPTRVEARFGVAILVLLSIPAAYALSTWMQPGAARRDALLAVPICLGIAGACILSAWMQGQATLLVDARELLQRQAAGQDVKPEGTISVTPPAEWRAGAAATYPVVVRNSSQRLWQATRLHPVLIRVTFSPRFGDEDAADVSEVRLERDVAPGETLRLTATTAAPPEPGMYALQHSLIRLGVSGATPSTAHEVVVAQALARGGDQSDVAAAPVEKPVARVDATAPATWRAGQRQSYTISVHNDGKQTWWHDRGYPAAIGITFAKRDEKTGKLGREISRLVPLPEDVAPGASATTTASVEAPGEAGAYVLRHWVRREGSGWSEPSSESTVTVQAGR